MFTDHTPHSPARSQSRRFLQPLGTTAAVLFLSLLSAQGSSVTWNGALNDNVWSTGNGNGAKNWIGGNSRFDQGDDVTFSEAGIKAVTLSEVLNPRNLTFNNVTGTYGFTALAGAAVAVGIAGSAASTTLIQVNNSGSLLLAGPNTNRLDDSTGITLAGGSLQISENGGSETLGALVLQSVAATPTSSVLNLSGSGASLRFNSLTIPSNTTLQVWNWNPGDGLSFGTSAINSTELQQIHFYTGDGTATGSNYLGTASIGSGGLVPVPEPTTLLGALGAVCTLGWRERRRFAGVARLRLPE